MTSEAVTATRAAERGPWWIHLLVVLPVTVLFVRHWTWAPSADSGDYAQYLLHARAILDGRPYGDTGYLYNPVAFMVGPREFPPGLPVLLAPLVALFGYATVPLRLFSIAALCAFALVAFRRLSGDVPVWQAGVAAAFTALAIESRLGTLAPISDPPFGLLVWATILAVDRKGPWTRARILAVTALGAAAITMRTAGVALIPALLAHAFLDRTRSGWRPAIPAAAWLVAGALALVTGVVNNPYAAGFSQPFDLTTRLATIVRTYRLALFEVELYPMGPGWAVDAYHLVATIFVGIGVIVLLPRMWRSFLAVFVATYVAMLAVSPFTNVRYTWPLLPLLGVALAAGLGATATRLLGPARGRVAMLAAVALVAVAALRVEGRREPPFAITNTADSEGLYRWLSEEARTTPVRAIYQNPRVVTLHSGVPAMAALPTATRGQMVAIDKAGITHLIWQRHDVSNCLQRWLNRAPVEFPGRFDLAYSNPTFRVFRVVKAAAPYTAEYEIIRPGSRLCREPNPSGV